ncbi:MAG: hypothetical protein U5L06_15190 [Rhodovibrio sp.]|nr:hypothetical protein [Rhodovibrio sp.]
MREGRVERKTSETEIAVRVNLDGTGAYKVETGIGFLDHMLAQLARHSLIDLEVDGQGRPVDRRAPHGRGHRHRDRPGGGPGVGRPQGHPALRRRLACRWTRR